jgi:outer membrane protein OmpA-like peptidoglycan-associated protein
MRQTMNFRLPLAIAFTGVLAATACTPVDQYSADDNQRAREGAIIGGLTGAVFGASRPGSGGNDVRDALIGGAVGAIAGGAIGANLDRQAAELRSEMDSRVQIINTGNELIVRMPQDILFAVDSATLQPTLVADLGDLARNLQRYPNTTVQVIGHTDNTGSAAYNQDLSQRRANAVANVLVSSGVSSGRIAAIGRGEDQPVASNLTPDGRAQNRRVDIVIRPTR